MKRIHCSTMRISARKHSFLRCVTVAGWSLISTLLTCPALAQTAAESYPLKPVRIVVAVAPGGGGDIVGRMVATKLSSTMRRQFVVDNRAGAGGTIAFAFIAKSPPDGYTLLISGSGFTTTPTVYPDLEYDPVNDFTAVSQINRAPYLLVVHPSLPVKSTQQLIALAKSKPATITFASGGTGSGPHFAAEQFRLMARVDLLHVPYKGTAEAITDLIAGRIDMTIGSVTAVLSNVKNGRLRLLAVSSRQRSTMLPNVPTISESGVPGYEAISWIGLLGPARMAPDIVAKLNTGVAGALKEPTILNKMLEDGGEPVTGTPEEFRQLIIGDLARNRKVSRDCGMKLGAGGA
jgi:tripartite-type tricarboxylate transporter receptor subunit TctC